MLITDKHLEAALNFPNHRGTATAIPLAAFGLSAFFFSCLSSWLFPGNTSDFLLVLAIATSTIVLVSYLFLQVVPIPNAYSVIPPAGVNQTRGNRLHRTKSLEIQSADIYQEPGMSTDNIGVVKVANPESSPDETSSFLTNSSTSSAEDRMDAESANSGVAGNNDVHHGNHIDIRGWALTRSTDFWLLFILLGLLTGTGLMTIK